MYKTLCIFMSKSLCTYIDRNMRTQSVFLDKNTKKSDRRTTDRVSISKTKKQKKKRM